MGKKQKVPRAVAAKQQAPKLNPFELKGSKRKFDVLGKRDKEGKKNVVKSREDAVNKRKKTLLVEYKQLRKANTFIDRRFGEDDPRLNEEDKALARFQAQRIKEAKKATRFHLADAAADGKGSDFTLTHGGRSLEELEELNARPTELLGDLDDDMLEDLVQQYHFGGGEEEAADGEDGQKRKTKKQIMEEIIAKSKAAKAEKAKQKEADEAALEQLDSTFKELVTNKQGALAAFVKPPGFDKGRKQKAETEEDAAYDKAARELVFEAKGQASERTLTAEELEEKEQARLAALEAARLKRMKADKQADAAAAGEEDASDDEAAVPQGGYAAKRARMQREAEQWEKRQRRRLDASGDALDENFALSDEEEGSEGGESDGEDPSAPSSALEARRQAQAAGDHPLQKAFREAAAKLAAKHGVAVPQLQDDSDEEEEGSEPEGDEGSGSEGEGEEGSGSEDEGADGSDGTEGLGSEGAEEEQQISEGSESEGEQETGREHEPPPPPAAAGSKQVQKQQSGAQKAAAAGPELEGPLDLSYTPPVPESYQEFAALVAGRPADQLQLAIHRIRVFNAAALATDNKYKLQVFYGILVQHFVMLAGQQPVPTAHLDVLTAVLLQLTPEVPFYAATVARTRIEKLHDKLAAALADPLSAGPLMGWPGSRQLLQLRLFAVQFPTSDKRHPVSTPLALLLGKHLMQCPVTCAYHAAVGLLLSGMALMNSAEAARFCPEVVNFLASALHAFVPVAAAAGKQQQAADSRNAADCVSLFTPGLLALGCCSAAARSDKAGKQQKKKGQKQQQQQQNGSDQQQQQLPSIQLHQLLSCPPNAAEFVTDSFKLQLLGCTVATAHRVCQLSSGCGDAAPEVLQPLCTAVAAAAGLRGWPTAAAAALEQLQQQLQETCQAVVSKRLPMVQSHRVKLVLPKEYNPRYEADFSLQTDYDPDRQRASARKLQRQLVKEKRGAMQELRRDATFMAAERDAEKARVDAERLASERAFYSELQAQEADAKSGGQRGMNPHKKKKK